MSFLFLIALYHNLIHKARTHLETLNMEEDAGIPAAGAALQVGRRKHRVSGEFQEFHDCRFLPCCRILNPGSRGNGGFVRFMGSLGSLETPGTPGAQLRLIHRLSTRLLYLGSLGV